MAKAEKSLSLMAAFSQSKDRAICLSELDCEEEYLKILKYYGEKLESCYIKTPLENLNTAFGHALLNMEYSYLYPYGWIESIQHWPTMWHMEHTAAEELCGNANRTKQTLRSQMKNIFDSGAIPDMCTTGKGRRDWGGNNQFFARELDHYLKMTGDIEFAKEAEPYMDRVISQTFSEYDPMGEGVLSWGTQIGNQEDFESTPGKGAATGSEGVRMLEIMCDLKRLLGKHEEASLYETRSKHSLEKLKEHLWLKDIGRFAWFKDAADITRLDTTYHGIIYPIIYDQIDDTDKITSIDHLRHRLTGPEGEIYQSNHFGDHGYWGVPTWGMQCGSDMQPFATFAYSKIGKAEDAIRPLKFIADRVCGEYQRGSWPETANEKRFAYFSPSAALYVQGIIEAVFGLSVNRITNTTFISPCLPETWNEAVLNIPGVRIEYKDNKYDICISNNTDKTFLMRIPPYESIDVKVNGKRVNVRTKACCGFFEASAYLGNGTNYKVEISYKKIDLAVSYPKNIAVGDACCATVQGAVIQGVEDRCGLFKNVSYEGNTMHATVNSNLLDKYEKFGWFGILNFSRRTFVLKLSANGMVFDYPITTVLMPKFVFECKYDKSLSVCVTNNTNTDFNHICLLMNDFTIKKECTIKSKTKTFIEFDIQNKVCLSPGKNKAVIYIDGTYEITFDADAEGDIKEIPLCEDQICPPEYWKQIGLFPYHGHMMQGPSHFMKDLFENNEYIDILKGVPLKLNKKGFIPLSYEKHRIVTVPLKGIKAKKLYVLISSFIDNHNVFADVFRMELQTEKEDSYINPVMTVNIPLPGGTDMGFGNPVIAGFATYVNGTQRNMCPEMPYTSDDGDYPLTKPYVYPERRFWSYNRATDVCNTVFNLVEIDLVKHRNLKELRIISLANDAAGGLYAIAAQC